MIKIFTHWMLFFFGPVSRNPNCRIFIKTALGSLDDCRRHTFHSFIKNLSGNRTTFALIVYKMICEADTGKFKDGEEEREKEEEEFKQKLRKKERDKLRETGRERER